MKDQDVLRTVASLLKCTTGLVITAGAGMGVDSGLPDFRGPQGFWNAYPALGSAGLHFEDIANPRAFQEDLRRAWGFYGHRLNLYRHTEPHDGFGILLALQKHFSRGAFVFTSNVDGQFEKAGFPEERIVECHGSIHFLQCLIPCHEKTWSAEFFHPKTDDKNCRLLSDCPVCLVCNWPARPNVLMFGDGKWIAARTAEQMERFRIWFRTVSRPVVLEIGAGQSVPTVRSFGESLGCPLVRINPREWQVFRPKDAGMEMGAIKGLRMLAEIFGLKSPG
uniref:protein acetyllysine N-acetyltransferase n=1 Tax=Leptospirillum ferriphilum TaxID=178606 RepID=A0A7C3LRH3_9BACT